MLGMGGGGALGSVDTPSVVEAADETFAPLAAAGNAAWWDANVDASDDNERRRADAGLTYSNAQATGSPLSVDALPREVVAESAL